MITGNDLIKLGYTPASWFGKALTHINDNNLSGNQMQAYIDSIQPIIPDRIPLNPNPPKYHINLTATTVLEQENLHKVTESMDLIMETPTVIGGCIMPDACPAGPIGTIPVGGVVVTKNAIHPGYHSADICCSVMITNLGRVDPKDALDTAQNVTHFGPGGRPSEIQFELPERILNEFKENPLLNSTKSLNLAKSHLGTQGDGNHFLFIGTSKNVGDTVVVTHHGSRGPGALLYKNGMEIAEKIRKQISPDTDPKNAWIPADSKEGKDYWNALQTIRLWTKQNHLCIHQAICEKMNLEIENRFWDWNEHNFVFKDGDLFYHAKGATPINRKFLPDNLGYQIIPMNMAEPILIVKGNTNENNLGFAPHGAGRNLSRTQHKLNQGDKSIKQIFKEETTGIDARFFFNQIDISELPSAYKNVAQVRDQIKQYNLCEIIDEIIPYGCIMAGHSENIWRKKR